MAELNGLEERGNIVVLAATNRMDSIDPALLRPGRLGDLVLHFPQPNRKAAHSILSRHLAANLPYASNGEGPAAAREALLDLAAMVEGLRADIAKLPAITGIYESAAKDSKKDGQREILPALTPPAAAQKAAYDALKFEDTEAANCAPPGKCPTGKRPAFWKNAAGCWPCPPPCDWWNPGISRVQPCTAFLRQECSCPQACDRSSAAPNYAMFSSTNSPISNAATWPSIAFPVSFIS